MSPETAPYVEGRLEQLIVFRLAGEEFAIPIGDVREIIRSGPVTPVPGARASVKGIINVRGEIAAVVDLRIRFGLPSNQEPEPKHLVITSQGKNLLALMVDEVAEVLRIGPNEIMNPPEIAGKIEPGCVAGVVTRGGRLIVLLDLAKTLADESLAVAETPRLSAAPAAGSTPEPKGR
jgi:purine-binding chemotaxis protein CheW